MQDLYRLQIEPTQRSQLFRCGPRDIGALQIQSGYWPALLSEDESKAFSVQSYDRNTIEIESTRKYKWTDGTYVGADEAIHGIQTAQKAFGRPALLDLTIEKRTKQRLRLHGLHDARATLGLLTSGLVIALKGGLSAALQYRLGLFYGDFIPTNFKCMIELVGRRKLERLQIHLLEDPHEAYRLFRAKRLDALCPTMYSLTCIKPRPQELLTVPSTLSMYALVRRVTQATVAGESQSFSSINEPGSTGDSSEIYSIIFHELSRLSKFFEREEVTILTSTDYPNLQIAELVSRKLNDEGVHANVVSVPYVDLPERADRLKPRIILTPALPFFRDDKPARGFPTQVKNTERFQIGAFSAIQLATPEFLRRFPLTPAGIYDLAYRAI